MIKHELQKGFTLVELLVVIAIISFMSSIVFASLQSARQKAIDAAQMQTIKEFKTALELFYSDNGRYPPIDIIGATSAPTPTAAHLNWVNLLPPMMRPYLSKLPSTDATGTKPQYTFSTGAGYQPGDDGQGHNCMNVLGSNNAYYFYETGTNGTSDAVRANDGGVLNGVNGGTNAYEVWGGTAAKGTIVGNVCIPS